MSKEIIFGFFVIFYSTTSGLLQTLRALLSSLNSLYFSLHLPVAISSHCDCRQTALPICTGLLHTLSRPPVITFIPFFSSSWFYIFHGICSKLLNFQTRVKIPKAGTARNKFFVVRFARKKYGSKFDPRKRHGEAEVSSGLKKRGKNSINTETTLQTQILLMDLFISTLFHWLQPVA